MKIFNYSKHILYIPSRIISCNKNEIKFNLDRKITIDDKAKLYESCDINELKIIIGDNLKIVDNYIYKYNLMKDDKDNYYLHKNKITPLTTYSKTLSSCWFIGTL